MSSDGSTQLPAIPVAPPVYQAPIVTPPTVVLPISRPPANELYDDYGDGRGPR